MDPSHAASLHEGGLGTRKDMVAMSMKVKEIHPTRGFSITHDGYTGAQRKMGMQGTRKFVPPHSVRHAPLLLPVLKVEGFLPIKSPSTTVFATLVDWSGLLRLSC